MLVLPDPIPDAVLRQILDAAIRAPSGGNRQGWGFVVIRDPAARLLASARHLAERLGEAPALIVACIAVPDRRPTLITGASIYPAVQNILLAARAHGIGSCLTTIHRYRDRQVKALLGIPPDLVGPAANPGPRAPSRGAKILADGEGRTMKARAAVLFEVGKGLEICDVDVQAPRAGEVLVRMAAGGVCHSDLHVMTGHLGAALPAILGHEGAGVVADVGPGVTSLRPGDHVIPLWRLSCGACEFCSGGRPALCNAGLQVRMTGRLPDGTTRFAYRGQEIKHFAGVSTFSEHSVIPERAVLKIPEDLPLDRAALLGCAVITGVGAVVHCARVRPGSSVAVFGTGGVGLNVVQGAALAGAEKIIAVDLLDSKLDFARRFGATHGVNTAHGDPVAEIRALTGGRGVDYAFEVIGQPRTIRQAYDTLAKRGVAVVVGVTPFTTEASVPVMSLVFEERVLTGSLYGSARPRIDIPKLIDLYRAGKLKLDELLTRSYPFAEINEAYAALERGEVARSVVTF